MAKRKIKIDNAVAYNAAMKRIDALMRMGEAIADKEAIELRTLALACHVYERSKYEIPAPKSFQGILELEMFKRKLKQKEMARLLNIGEAKLSQILSSKREPDIAILKAAHEKLGIDGNLLLSYV
jgi:HTH-type transcriptional regulator / antitoxin HigA